MLYTALYMPATRTQIYLTEVQRAELDALRRRDGKTLAEVVREAVDAYLAVSGPNVQEALDATRGALPELEVPARDEWDRH